MSKPLIKSDTDNKDAPPTTLKLNPETLNLIRKDRGPKKTLNERIAEFEEKLKKDEQAEEAKKNPAIAMLPIQVNTEEERMGATSARSDQRLIMSDQDESSARRDENAEGKRRRGPRRGPKARIQEPEIMETNVDTGGQVNPAFEDTETIRTANEEDEAGNKPLKKRVRRAKKMTDKIDQTRDPFILAVIVHKTDKLRTDTNIYHPVVRIHILDLDADGQYVKKTKRERNVLFYYEKENRNLDHISPIMTSPFDFKENRTIIPRWEERVVFNEEFSHFVQEHPNVLIMFELLDSFKHSTDESGAEIEYKDPSHTSQDTGRNWNRIAWAFLKLVGSNNSLNIGKKIRLQLYYSQSQYRQNLLDSLVPEVYSLYKQGPRIKYPSSLHVTIRPIHPAKQFYLGIGSSYMIDEEMGMVDEGRSTAANSAAELRKASGVDGAEEDPDRPIDDPNAAVAKKKTVIWSRLPGKACNVPNELALSFPSTKYGCYSVKFSTSGSYLACACVDEDNGYPILVFDIPEGNFHASFSGHFGVIYEIAWSNLDRYMLTASHDATVRVFDFEKKSRDAYKIFPHPSFIYSAKFHPYSFDTVCTAGYDKVIRVWSLGNKKKTRQQKYGELLQELSGHMGFVNSICFSNDGNFLYSADSVGVIKLWNCFPIGEMEFKQWSFREDIEIDELKNQCINYIQTHPNRFSILIQTRDNQLKLIDTRVKMVVQRYKGTFSFTQNLKSAISPCGTFLFNSGSDTKIYCWNIITGDLVANPIVLNYMKPARDIDFHPYDNYIAFCSYETRAPIYVYKYNPKKAMHDVVQAAPNVAFESDIEIEKKPSESKIPKPVLIDKEDPLSARKAEASSKSQFKYTGPKDYQEIVVALYDYTAQRNDELDFVKGDEIVVLVRENENWCLGEMVKTRQQGYFPANYVQDKSHFVQSRARYQSQAPKYSVRDALLEYQRVYDENAFDSMGIKKDPLTGQTSDKSPRKPKTTDSVNVINEVPTKDGSEQINRRKDQTKRRAFAHIISGSDHTVTEI